MRTPKHFSRHSPFRRKAFRLSVCAAVAAAALLATSCGRMSPPPPAGTDAADIAPAAVSAAIARHLADAVAPDYGGDWEHAIPLVRIVATDATDPADIRAWGDFEVWNYISTAKRSCASRAVPIPAFSISAERTAPSP